MNKRLVIKKCSICDIIEVEGKLVGTLEDFSNILKITKEEINKIYIIKDTILSKDCYDSFYKDVPTKHKFSYERCNV